MNPRTEIENSIQKGDLQKLMTGAAQIHGHYCPGLSMGVIAACHAMQQMGATSDGLEDLIAVTETNNCFSDGIQFVTGCTFGNNALIFKDFGKTAFTLSKRDGKGIRLFALKNSRDEIRKAYPLFSELYQKVVKEKNHDPEIIERFKDAGIKRAFETLKIPVEKLFRIENITIRLPDYAPSHDSLNCNKCNEEVMSSRVSADQLCFSCQGKGYFQLDGHGISLI